MDDGDRDAVLRTLTLWLETYGVQDGGTGPRLFVWSSLREIADGLRGRAVSYRQLYQCLANVPATRLKHGQGRGKPSNAWDVRGVIQVFRWFDPDAGGGGAGQTRFLDHSDEAIAAALGDIGQLCNTIGQPLPTTAAATLRPLAIGSLPAVPRRVRP